MKSPFNIKLNNVKADWFVEESGRCVFSGKDYGRKCVAACGPSDFAKVQFISTSNPRYSLWTLRRQHGDDWIVHEALWVEEKAADSVLKNVHDMFLRVDPTRNDPWVVMDRKYVLPILRFCAKKNGIEGLRHSDFVAEVKRIETDRLHHRMINNGVHPEIAKRYQII